MTMLPRYLPRHCARGMATLASPSNGFVGYLYNDSTGRDFLIVRHVGVYSVTDVFYAFVGSFQGHNGTQGGVVSTIVTGETQMPGVLYADDTASPPTPDFQISTFVADGFGWNHEYPIAVLQPGWSFFVSFAGATGAATSASFYWQRCSAEDIDGSLQDLALKLAGG